MHSPRGESSRSKTTPEAPPERGQEREHKPREKDMEGGSRGRDKESPPPVKRQKFSRSRTACLQCRQRKSKCGALPPGACPNCIEADLPCAWPTEDGRSSKARLKRYRNAQLGVRGDSAGAGMVGVTGTPAGGVGGVGVGVGGMGMMGAGVAANVELAEGWLDRLLASGAAYTATPVETPAAVPSVGYMGSGTSASSSNPATSAASAHSSSAVIPRFNQAATPSSTGHHFPVMPAFQPFLPDPAQFVWAVSSRLPTVEEGSPNDERSVASDPSPSAADQRRALAAGRKGKTVKVSWWRPHGQTAIAPGLKKYTLRVRVQAPQDNAVGLITDTAATGQGELIGPDGLPPAPIMRHLLDVFMTHFGCQFPFIDRGDLEGKIENRTGSVFLLLSIAAVAARFSTHPAIALPDLQPYEYGTPFYARAKSLLGSMLGFPRRETVVAFILLAHMGFAADSECEVWMMTGNAVRMAIDCGLHVSPPEDSSMSDEERRLNRLVFWSVLLMDYALSFGVGRQTAIRPDDITQTLPTEEDLRPAQTQTQEPTSSSPAPRSPFPFAAKMMLAYGPLINALNRAKGGDANAARAAAIREYNRLPPDMQWNVTNLQRHAGNNQGPIFLHLHLWMHTIIASGYLTGSSLLRRTPAPAPVSGTATPSTSSLWRNSARTIGDILVLSDIINPHVYFALPFVNQAWFVAGCCYVKEIEQQQTQAAESHPPSPRATLGMSTIPEDSPEADAEADAITPSDTSSQGSSPDADEEADETELEQPHARSLSRALLTSVATTNITTLQQGLAKLAKYWYGAEWISGALKQRVQGIKERDVDLVSVRENFDSFVSLPDGGVVRAAEVGGNGAAGDAGEGEVPVPQTHEAGTTPTLDLDFLSLPFDLVEGGNVNVVETEVPIEQVFASTWVRGG